MIENYLRPTNEGVIKFYKEDKGYGFVISGEDEYFFHITNSHYTPSAGDRVTFELKSVKRGVNAFHIKPV